MIFDYIIIGQGIAGTTLALQLIEKKYNVLVIDEENEISSSKIAAGIYNPIVFKRFSESWMANILIPYATEFYKKHESLFNASFLIEKPIAKLINKEEFDFLSTKRKNFEYIKSLTKFPIYENHLKENFGAVTLNSCGWLNTGSFLEKSKNYLIQNNAFYSSKINYKNIEINKLISYENFKSKNLIFCEGFKAQQNPFFPNLPFKLTKGEVLTIEIDNFKPEEIINKNFYLVHLKDNIFKVGATYNWNDISEQTSEEGKNELIEKLKSLLKVEFRIIEHKASVRPTVIDRRPLMGQHTAFKNLFIFNGLGTKGVMIAPYFAAEMIRFLSGETTLSQELMWNRRF